MSSSAVYANASLPLYSEAKLSSSSTKQEFMRTMAKLEKALLSRKRPGPSPIHNQLAWSHVEHFFGLALMERPGSFRRPHPRWNDGPSGPRKLERITLSWIVSVSSS